MSKQPAKSTDPQEAKCHVDDREADFFDEVKKNLRGGTADDLDGLKASVQRASRRGSK